MAAVPSLPFFDFLKGLEELPESSLLRDSEALEFRLLFFFFCLDLFGEAGVLVVGLGGVSLDWYIPNRRGRDRPRAGLALHECNENLVCPSLFY